MKHLFLEVIDFEYLENMIKIFNDIDEDTSFMVDELTDDKTKFIEHAKMIIRLEPFLKNAYFTLTFNKDYTEIVVSDSLPF